MADDSGLRAVDILDIPNNAKNHAKNERRKHFSKNLSSTYISK